MCIKTPFSALFDITYAMPRTSARPAITIAIALPIPETTALCPY